MYLQFDNRKQNVQVSKFGRTGSNIKTPRTIIEGVIDLLRSFKEQVFFLVFEADEETSLLKMVASLEYNFVSIKGRNVVFAEETRTYLIKFLNAYFIREVSPELNKHDPFSLNAVRLVATADDFGFVVSHRAEGKEKGNFAIKVKRGVEIKMPAFAPFVDQTIVLERFNWR